MKDKSSLSFGKMICELIKEAKLSQSDFYQGIGITKSYFYDIASGKTKPPPAELQIKMIDQIIIADFITLSFDRHGANVEILLDKQNTDALDIAFRQWKNRGFTVVPENSSKSWVEERVIPPNRQGIEEVLVDFGLTEYNLLDMLLATNGRCQLDSSYIREIKPSFEGEQS